MDIYVLRNQGVIINKHAIKEVKTKQDGYNRTIGNILFNNDDSISILNPSDFDLIKDNIFLEINNPPIADFNYIIFGLESNHVDKHMIKTPISISPNNYYDIIKKEDVLLWSANMVIKIKQLLGEE